MSEALVTARKSLSQINEFWGGLNPRGRITLTAAGLLTLAVIGAFVWRMGAHSYRPLYTGLSESEAGAIVQRLDASNTPYRLANGGTAILAPEPQIDRLRLQFAAEGLPKTGRLGFELFDQTSFGATEFAERVNFQRALEGELERTISSLEEVRQARVHLTLPRRSVFTQQDEPAKASVVVGLETGRELSKERTQAIARLASSAVESLEHNRVVVMDQTGRLFSERWAESDDLTDKQLAHRRKIEQETARKIIETLEPRLGPGGVRANVAVDVDWDSGEQTEEIVDPNPVALNSQRTSEMTFEPAEEGAPGTDSNLPRAPEAAMERRYGVERTAETVNYQTSRTVTRMTLERGNVERMSIAVLVDYRVEPDAAKGEYVRVARDAGELETIRQLVLASSGARLERGDTVTVESLPFSMLEPLPALPQTPKDPAEDLFSPEWFERYKYQLIAAAVAAFVLLNLALLVRWKLRRRRARIERRKALAAEQERIALEEAQKQELANREAEENRLLKGFKAAAPYSTEGAALRRHVEETADEHPERVARLVKAWMHEDD
jgi:flagellar M-ring protein FliF